MKPSERIAQRFNNLELALESLELNLLQAVWSLERAVQTQIETSQKLQQQIHRLIEVASNDSIGPKKFESDRPRFETKNNLVR